MQSFQSVAPSKYISFARQRLSKDIVIAFLPEIAVQFDAVCFPSIPIEAMPIVGSELHSIMAYSSLHELSSEMQTKIQNILTAVATFGDRVLPLIHADATARAWFLNEHLLIQAHHWRLLARRVMALLKQLGLLEPLDAMGAVSILTCSSEEYPFKARLHDAGRRLVDIYGAYGAPVGNNFGTLRKRTARTSNGVLAKCRRLY